MTDTLAPRPAAAPLFDTVLVANRGEIAVRVIRTLRRLGIRSVAVFSDADAGARHVREADVAVRIGPAPARESYLDIDAVVQAALRTGAQAVHPGYGFLSENADFARALADAGITFVGPPVHSLDAMADKIRAKETVSARNVPVVPGIADPSLSDAQILAEADRVGFPLLIKPSAGGGGKGMVAVHAADELPAALASARRTAASAFGDDTLLLERLITAPRHIEVQVFADAHGHTVHLGERECSLQRRHQKVIEEAPAPLLTGLADGAGLRARLGQAAVDAAESVGYVGAGTVEFLVSDARPDEFFFMEMNTRLQVEHPVSEEVVRVRGARVDFVELQLRVAAGEDLGFAQEDVDLEGAAAEARVYAEDPAHGFLPAAGPVLRWEPPVGEGIRVDTLLFPPAPDDGEPAAQPEVTGHYDPMIAKVIASGQDRAQALARLEAALAQTVLFGVTSNLAWLRDLVAREDVRAGALTTSLIDAAPAWEAPAPSAEVWDLAGGAFAPEPFTSSLGIKSDDAAPAADVGLPVRRAGAWHRGDGWRAAGAPAPALPLRWEERSVLWRGPGSLGPQAEPSSQPEPSSQAEPDSQARPAAGGPGGQWVRDPADPDAVWIHSGGHTWRIERLPRAQRVAASRAAAAARDAPAGAGSPEARAPMPGTVAAVSVSTGDHVEAGAELAVLEAMKMEHPVTAGIAGIVTVHVRRGDSVPARGLVATVTPTDAGTPGPDAPTADAPTTPGETS